MTQITASKTTKSRKRGKILSSLGSWSEIDTRALSLWRRLLAVLVLVDLWQRSGDLAAHYSDQGVLPRSLIFSPEGRPAPWFKMFRISGEFLWSVLYLDGSTTFATVVFGITALSATWLLLGRWPCMASFTTWVLLSSIQARNPLINSGGDTLLRLMLFWSIWQTREDHSGQTKPLLQITAGMGLITQIAAVYGVTALLKYGDAWISSGTAISEALKLQSFVRPWAATLLEYPAALRLLTRLVWGLEALLALMILSPIYVKRTRCLAFIGILALQIGIGLTLNIGLFQAISVASAVAIIPSPLWNYLGRKMPRLCFLWQPYVHLSRTIEVRSMNQVEGSTYRTAVAHWILHISLPLVIGLILIRNTDAVTRGRMRFPKPALALAEVLRLEQYWGMFAPKPPAEEQGVFQFLGEVPEHPGMTLDSQGVPMPHPSSAFRNDHWRKLYLNLTHDTFADVRPSLGNFLYASGVKGKVIFRRNGKDDQLITQFPWTTAM